MKSNPFYALSASAMPLGCYLLGEALQLEAGKLRGLLVLIAVLQLYELLLVGLGAFLVRSGQGRPGCWCSSSGPSATSTRSTSRRPS
jgi:hypothetical protein